MTRFNTLVVLALAGLLAGCAAGSQARSVQESGFLGDYSMLREGKDGEAVARRWMDQAERRKAWLILYTHDVTDSPSDFGCTPQALERLADEAMKRGFEIVTVAEGARRAA